MRPKKKGSTCTARAKTLKALFRVWPGRESLFWQQFSSAQYPDGLRLQRAGYQTTGCPPGRRKCRTAAPILSWGRCFQNLDMWSQKWKGSWRQNVSVTNISSEFILVVLMLPPDTHRWLWWLSLRRKRHWPDPTGWQRWRCCWDPHLHRQPPPLPGVRVRVEKSLLVSLWYSSVM